MLFIIVNGVAATNLAKLINNSYSIEVCSQTIN